ncbi:MAG TPA: hypothetical protein VLB06_02085 [Sulfuricaulis sp.]|nr:hypothetical protein [Sulfuricaulis sp.]
MEISFACFAAIADIYAASKTRKNSFRPSKKTSQADLYITYLKTAFSGPTDATTLKLKAAMSVLI